MSVTGPPPIWLQLVKKLVRFARELVKPLLIRWLTARNRFSRRSALGDAPVVVSLTTHGTRTDSVFLTIEAIARGRLRPMRLILWLDDEVRMAALPDSLRRLIRRGVEVRLTENLGPHTKYFPTVPLALEAGLTLVTADDDILYPTGWLRRLMQAAEQHPTAVNCYKAHLVRMVGETILPYDNWPQDWTSESDPRVFATGVSGVAYPKGMLEELQRRGKAFMTCTPKADDVWLHFVAVESAVAVRQIGRIPVHFLLIPGTDGERLSAANVDEGRNDMQIAATYSALARERLSLAEGSS